MKIVFLCSSLQPGRDGAGDQARRLAGALIHMGHQVKAVAIRELGISERIEENQDADDAVLSVLRLPAHWKATKRYNHFENWIESFNPDWVSIQFVNWGFQKYGLPVDLIFYLRKSIGDAKLHIMFQETWCGRSPSSGRKEKILGGLQKALIKNMISFLKPQRIFTNTKVHEIDLQLLGIEPGIAPVFGNIPVNEMGAEEEWKKVAEAVGIHKLQDNKNEWLILGFFGTVYKCLGLEELLLRAAEAAAQMGKNFGVIGIGHGRGEDIGAIVGKISDASFWQTGMLEEPAINRTMQLVDLAVVTTASDVINKSSTTSAWLERGVPALISEKDHTYNKEELEPRGIYQVKDWKDIEKAYQQKEKLIAGNTLSEVAKTYAELETI